MSIVSFDKRPVTSLIEVWHKYCAERGLTTEMLDPIKGELLTIEKASKVLGNKIYGFKSLGAIGAYVYPVAADEYQARLLYDPDYEVPVPKPGEHVKPIKRPRYCSRPGAASVLYIPPHITDWWTGRYPLYIVEGALKAVRLAAIGIHAVAIQGIQNFRVGNKQTPLIPDLARFSRSDNADTVTLFFDSDASDPEARPDMWNGIHMLSQELMKLRSNRRDSIYHCFPPNRANGEKNGPDDYLNQVGIEEFFKYVSDSSRKYTDNEYLRAVCKFNDMFIFDNSSGKVYDCVRRQLISEGHANLIMLSEAGNVEDIFSKRRVAIDTKRLLADPSHRKADGLLYQPDVEDIYFRLGDTYHINTFNTKDVPVPIKPPDDFMRLYRYMIRSLCRDSPSAVDLIETVVARHVQFPATTPKYGILFTGKQGAGKSLMAQLLGSSIGKFHNARVDPTDSFNATWRAGVAAKEWAELDERMNPEWLKDTITSRSIEVNRKYGERYDQANYMLHFFTCNGLKSIIQEGDRRMIIAGYALPDNKASGLEFEKYVNGLGPNYMRWYFLNEVDCSDYDNLDVTTEMRGRVIEASKSNKELVKDEVLADLDQIDGLECAPNFLLDLLLEPYKFFNVMMLNREFGQYFTEIGAKGGVVKIQGKTIKFRAFKNHHFWGSCTDRTKYEEQYEIAMKHMPALLNRKKF